MRIFISTFLLLACVASAQARVPDSEPVATLLGEVVTYGDLKPSAAKEKSAERYVKDSEMDTWRRSQAAVNLRERALEATVGRQNPSCDLAVTDGEISTFVDWWRGTMEESRRILNEKWEDAGRRGAGAYETVDDIVLSNPSIADGARKKIALWKVNLCLYQAHGGGRVHEDRGSYAFLQAGETLIASYEHYAGVVYPIVVSAGTPLNAYLKHFEDAMAAGDLVFASGAYEESFLGYYRNDKLPYFAPEAEATSVETRYWRYPLVPPVLAE